MNVVERAVGRYWVASQAWRKREGGEHWTIESLINELLILKSYVRAKVGFLAASTLHDVVHDIQHNHIYETGQILQFPSRVHVIYDTPEGVAEFLVKQA